MTCRMQTDAMHAVDKVPVQGVNGGRGHCVGRRVARMADNVLSVGLSQHRRADEEVEGESHREVLKGWERQRRVCEGDEDQCQASDARS